MDIHEIINRIYRMRDFRVEKVVKTSVKGHILKVTMILRLGKTERISFPHRERNYQSLHSRRRKRGNVLDWKEGSTIVSLKSYVNNQ